MFIFIKKMFYIGPSCLSTLVSAISWSCISLKNPLSIKINKCGGNCYNINDPYANICVPDTVKDLNVIVFNLMSRTNETRHIK